MNSDTYKSPSVIRQFIKGSYLRTRRALGIDVTLPYMKQREIEIIEEILTRLKPKKCLEYGGGYSTLYYPKFLDESAQWISVEHHPEWFEIIKKKITRKNTVMHSVRADKDSDNNTIDEYRTYVNFPEKGAPYDFILVDGRVRDACVDKAYDMLSDDGILLLHDANRKNYFDIVKDYPHSLLLNDFRKTSGGLAFATKSKPVKEFFDVDKHAAVWERNSVINNFFKFKFLMGKKAKPFNLQVR
ncbi:hypothetical protein FUAX_10460 [Fulvitalea axinellae]|uniref:Class I SAM-dependent methyltransferase n=1 Tax=Fulvitalea axinellae TaxID=1182444 RepID=A0AAU9D2L2_9BACT|nr:hypothetical protein FUAX_10460 [Fulvitalea axinellae]